MFTVKLMCHVSGLYNENSILYYNDSVAAAIWTNSQIWFYYTRGTNSSNMLS